MRLRPDASLHDPRPDKLRALIEAAGFTQAQAAERIGVSARQMRAYLAAPSASTAAPAPYTVTFALDALCTPAVVQLIQLLDRELTAEQLAAADAATRKRLAALLEHWAALARPSPYR
jgi:hypothetical protein